MLACAVEEGTFEWEGGGCACAEDVCQSPMCGWKLHVCVCVCCSGIRGSGAQQEVKPSLCCV